MKKILLILALTGCVTAKPEAPRQVCPPSRYNVTVAQFASCWTICGKGSKLASMTETTCICTDSRRFLHAFAVSPGGDISISQPAASSSTPVYESGNAPTTKAEASESVFEMIRRLSE